MSDEDRGTLARDFDVGFAIKEKVINVVYFIYWSFSHFL